tara:strand:- start:3395 stop:3763 length:369 start_codon:yes stop_codon:yes gene_type:complete
MAWATPKTWQNLMVDDDQLNTQLRDNMNVLSTHTHTGAAGFGSSSIAPTVLSSASQTILTFVDQEANPSTNGILQRNGNHLVYYNGSTVLNLTAGDQVASIASMRSLGTGATQASAGNHTHT